MAQFIAPAVFMLQDQDIILVLGGKTITLRKHSYITQDVIMDALKDVLIELPVSNKVSSPNVLTAKPVPKTTALNPMSTWPFPVKTSLSSKLISAECTNQEIWPPKNTKPANGWPFPKTTSATSKKSPTWPDFAEDDFECDQLYDLVRVNGGRVEYRNLSLDEANDKVLKNSLQKKALLKIVYSGTDDEV